MDQPPYRMDQSRREMVLASLTERGWNLMAAHMRSTRWLWNREGVSAAVQSSLPAR